MAQGAVLRTGTAESFVDLGVVVCRDRCGAAGAGTARLHHILGLDRHELRAWGMGQAQEKNISEVREGVPRHQWESGISQANGQCRESWGSRPGSPLPAKEVLSPTSTAPPATQPGMGKHTQVKHHEPHIPNVLPKTKQVTSPSQHPLPGGGKKGS